ncbi:MAG: MOSC domain-containing protein [Gemmatimonadota bacterium]
MSRSELTAPSRSNAPPAVDRGRVEALWVKRVRRGPMDPVEAVLLEKGLGIRGNADRGGWRQVTVIEAEMMEALEERFGESLDPAMRRANVMVRGVRLAGCRGKVLHLGGCRIEMRGETVPCERMDETLPGLRDALKGGWAGGAFGRVAVDGEVRLGDPAWLEDA